MIAFVGMPGSGKSTIGRQLARRLDVRFYDSDLVIERRIGCSIREFFDTEGEPFFRELEQAVVGELTQNVSGVLATGGGIVLRQANRDYLQQRCNVIYLHSAPEEVFCRLRHDQNRPLLQVADPLARLNELYQARDPLYREVAHFVVETGAPSIAVMVNIIVAQLKLKGLGPVDFK